MALNSSGNHDLRRVLHVGGHEGVRPRNPVGIAREGRDHGGILGHHDEVEELVGLLHVLRVRQQHDLVHPEREAFLRVAVLHVRVGKPRAEDRAVPVERGHDVVVRHLLGHAIVHRQPFRLGLQQLVADLLQHLGILGAGLAADIPRGQGNHVVHLGRHVDLAHQFRRRVEEDGAGVDVTRIDLLVHRHAGRAPLPRHGVFPARIVGHVHPFRRDVRMIAAACDWSSSWISPFST